MSEKLNNRQEAFVSFYLENPNATEAAKRAGYSDRTAYSQGQRLLKNVEIQARVQKRVEAVGLTADEVLKELSNIAKGNWSTYKGDKIKSLELLGKHHKLWTEKSEIDLTGNIEVATRMILPTADE